MIIESIIAAILVAAIIGPRIWRLFHAINNGTDTATTAYYAVKGYNTDGTRIQNDPTDKDDQPV